jgi:hypothetical protein
MQATHIHNAINQYRCLGAELADENITETKIPTYDTTLVLSVALPSV